MRIAHAKVVVCSPGRNFVTIKITTDDGISGLGDATLNGRELSVASYLTDHVIPLLVGRDARRIEDSWQYLVWSKNSSHMAREIRTDPAQLSG
jgi:mannonate dehydratase